MKAIFVGVTVLVALSLFIVPTAGAAVVSMGGSMLDAKEGSLLVALVLMTWAIFGRALIRAAR